MMNDGYVLIKNLYSSEDISLILDKANNKGQTDSKVGNRVAKEKKIRKDVFFSQSESKEMDKIYFNKIQKIVKEKFNLILKYRETYKVGTYYGDEKGFYIPHTDTQGGMQHRKISVVICLSKIDDYEGGIFKFINLKKDLKFDVGDIIIFDSNLLHGVEPVTQGVRQVLVTFMWDKDGEQIRQKNNPAINNSRYFANNILENNNILHNKQKNKIYDYEAFKLITLIPTDSGPGNQIIGIKECLILSKLLNRRCIIPPIREHYLKSNKIFYNFNDIFTLNLSNIIIDNETSNILNHIDNNKRYCIHSNYINKKLRHEQIIDSNTNDEILLKYRSIKNKKNLDELKNIDDNLIIIKHLFNNVYINESGINGDFHSDFNSNFKDIYSEICNNWDYSDYIKLQGDDYIKKTFDNLSYTAIHIRLPDIMDKTIDQYTNNEYSDDKIVEIFSNLKIKDNNPIFISSNNIDYLKKIGVNANFINITNKYNSFIEQYICCMSENFYYLNLENTRFNSSNNRSTWTSFVIDYRLFLRKLNNNFNLRN